MQTVRRPAPQLADMVPYDPKYLPADVYISANENAHDVPAPIREAVNARIAAMGFNRYPDPLANRLRSLIAEANGVTRNQVLVGNGGDELLFSVALAWGGTGRTYLDLPPTFSVYENNALLTGTRVEHIPRRPDFSIDEGAVLARVARNDIDFIIVTSPNNPTGNVADRDFVLSLLYATDALVVLDEAYCEFSEATSVSLVEQHRNLAVLRTFSKAYSLAGVRLGYMVAHEEVITELVKVRQPYSVDAVSQVIGECVMEQRGLFVPVIEAIIEERAAVMAALARIEGVEAYPSEANYILFKADDAAAIWQELYDGGILIRDLTRSAGLEDCLRVSIGTPEENKAFITALEHAMEKRRR